MIWSLLLVDPFQGSFGSEDTCSPGGLGQQQDWRGTVSRSGTNVKHQLKRWTWTFEHSLAVSCRAERIICLSCSIHIQMKNHSFPLRIQKIKRSEGKMFILFQPSLYEVQKVSFSSSWPPGGLPSSPPRTGPLTSEFVFNESLSCLQKRRFLQKRAGSGSTPTEMFFSSQSLRTPTLLLHTTSSTEGWKLLGHIIHKCAETRHSGRFRVSGLIPVGVLYPTDLLSLLSWQLIPKLLRTKFVLMMMWKE